MTTNDSELKFWARAANILKRAIIIYKLNNNKIEKRYSPESAGTFPRTLFIYHKILKNGAEIFNVFDSKKLSYYIAQEAIKDFMVREAPKMLSYVEAYYRDNRINHIKEFQQHLKEQLIQMSYYKGAEDAIKCLNKFAEFSKAIEKTETSHNSIKDSSNTFVCQELKCKHKIDEEMKKKKGCEVMCNQCKSVLSYKEKLLLNWNIETIVSPDYKETQCMFCSTDKIYKRHSNHACCENCWNKYLLPISDTKIADDKLVVTCPAYNCKYIYRTAKPK